MFYIWDLETYANCFLFAGMAENDNQVTVFEISDRKNERAALLDHLSRIQTAGWIMVGFNSLGFDYPILHSLLTDPYMFDAKKAHQLCVQIISQQDYSNAGNLRIAMKDRIIPQCDLVKINHFDNKSRRTSLKSLQVAMRSESVEDLPYDPNVPLTSEQMDKLVLYNKHDVTETRKFFFKCKHLINMREELLQNGVLGGDVLNYSEVRIGTEYLIKKIGRAKCFVSPGNPRQTIRHEIAFKDVILPKIQYRTDHFNEVFEWFKKQIIYITGEERPKHEATLAGLQFHFGVGGVHASVENKHYKSNDTHVIRDIDVSGMYVAVAIANGFHPEHLGQEFVTAYRQLQQDRKQYPKSSVMNLLLKLAGNGAYGNSNNTFSPFYDPKYTYSVTINGQLQLLQLVELISLIPGVEIIQANTDGITVYMPRSVDMYFKLWCDEWESNTGLKLEHVEYSDMWIRDVNNYLAITIDGKVKRKGAYWYPESEKDYSGSGSGTVWNKDFSNMAVQKVIEPVLRYGWDASDVLRVLTDPFDFMLSYKTPGNGKVFIGDKPMTKTVRYYVAKNGEKMIKRAKPKGELGSYKRKNKLTDKFYESILKEIGPGVWDARIHTGNKSKYTEVITSIQSGKLVSECNVASKFDWNNLDWSYYESEVNKLIV